MYLFSDSHCHLDWFSNPELIVQKALLNGVHRIIALSIGANNFEKISALKNMNGVYCAYGLHPLYQKEHLNEHLDLLATYLNDAIAIGEIGLDGTIDLFAEQKRFFMAQLALAQDFNLPVLIHARSALEEVLNILKRFSVRFVIHSFTGSDVQLGKIIQMGGYIGIGGTSTYERAKRLQRQLKALPADRYLLETDAPDQPIFGKQGQDNLPEYIPEIAQNLALLRGENLEKISIDSENNFKRFLGI